MKIKCGFLFTACLAITGLFANPQEIPVWFSEDVVLVFPEKYFWQEAPTSFLTTGRQEEVLLGSPEGPGLYVYYAKYAQGADSIFHAYPQELHVLLLSGSATLVVQDVVTKAEKEVTLDPGTFFVIPAKVPFRLHAVKESIFFAFTDTPHFPVLYPNEEETGKSGPSQDK